MALPSEDFEVFWKAYPRRVAKAEARKAWAKLDPAEVTLETLLTALAWQREQDQWRKDGGQFIPHPATWLRAERWADEPVEVAPVWDTRTKGNASAAVAQRFLLRMASRVDGATALEE